MSGAGPSAELKTLRERASALRHLPTLFRLVWQTSPGLTLASLALRLLRAVQPLLLLYVGKLIVDEVVAQAGAPSPGATLEAWIESGRLARLGRLLGLEFALAILSDLLGRASALVDQLLSERYGMTASVRLMRHAADLDLAHLESSDGQDRLERARRQVAARSSLLTQAFGQLQDMLTVASLALGLAVYAPWLIVLIGVALVPAFLGEANFNAQGYRLSYSRTPERR